MITIADLTVIALVLPLSFDTLAVSAGIGAAGIDSARHWRIVIVMTAFETFMPVIGFLVGAATATRIGHVAGYLSFGVLAGAGLYLIKESRAGADENLRQPAVAERAALIFLGLSVSLDELAIGFGGGLIGLPVPLLVGLISGQALVASHIGLRLGSSFAGKRSEMAERAAGVILLGAAVLALIRR